MSTTGVRKIHSRTCPQGRDGTGGRCRCKPTWEAMVTVTGTRDKIRKRFPTETAARAWRATAITGVATGTVTASDGTTVRQAGEALLAGMRAGTVRSRSGRTFKPSVIASYESSLVQHIYPEMGPRRLASVRRSHIQAFADRLATREDGKARAASTIKNVLMPLRVILRQAMKDPDSGVTTNPITTVDLPRGEKRRDRVAAKDMVPQLIAAVPIADRAAWGLAFYAGLRLGELRALDWDGVDLDTAEITVSRAWCNRTKQMTATKSWETRTVPITGELRRVLLEHRMAMGRVGGLVVQRVGGGVESGDSLAWRSEKAWEAAGLDRYTMHEARHTYASLMIMAGVPITGLKVFMGHKSITTTVDRYGHLYPSERQAAVAAFDAMFEQL